MFVGWICTLLTVLSLYFVLLVGGSGGQLSPKCREFGLGILGIACNQYWVNKTIIYMMYYLLSSYMLGIVDHRLYNFPVNKCAKLMVNTIHKFFIENPSSLLRNVRIAVFDRATLEEFKKPVIKLTNH